MKLSRLMLLVLVIALISLVGYRFFEYSAAPIYPKVSHFKYPDGPTAPIVKKLTISSDIPLSQTGGTIDDASHLNLTPVAGIIRIRNESDVKNALAFARKNKLKVSIAGRRHSMGGQTFIQNGLVLDMMGLNKIRLNKKERVLTVQSGATWADIQAILDRSGLSVMAMQSINIFSVGGTLSVNAHGIAHNPGPIADTVRSIKVMLADGNVVVASRTQNPELFSLVIGGYGLFGVILEAELAVTTNRLLQRESTWMSIATVPLFYQRYIDDNPSVNLVYGRVSISPESYLNDAVIHRYRAVSHTPQSLPGIEPSQGVWFRRLIFNLSKTGAVGRWIRWQLEKYLEPVIYRRHWYRNEHPVITRNQAMFDGMEYLYNRQNDTDILQEYFLNPEDMPRFLDGLKRIVHANQVNLLNVTVRVVHKDTTSFLPYATQDRLAFVLYFNQKFDTDDSRRLEAATRQLVDLVNSLNGTFYLPYQLYYSKSQLRDAYPRIDEFFKLKRKYDPDEILMNTFYAKYGLAPDSD